MHKYIIMSYSHAGRQMPLQTLPREPVEGEALR